MSPEFESGSRTHWLFFLNIIGFAFSAYHALKAHYRSSKFSNASHSITHPQLRTNWSLFAEVLMTEAGEGI